MRKSMSKRLIATVVLTTMIAGNSTVAVYANEVKKDESVYVTLNSDGTENEKIVSDWIHSDNSNATITDKSSLEEIKNVKGDEKPEQNGENLTWTLKDNDLYYQGKSNKQLPISVNIKYYLDGSEVSKEDIAGKSGKVKITLKFTNNSYEEKKIGDKVRKIYTPISVAGGMTLPTDTFKNVKINQGKLISEGSTNVASFAALPGMKETLDIDSEASSKINVDLTDTIEVEADATNFSLGPIMMAATTMMPELQSLDAADDIDKLNDSLKKLKDASDKLLDGTNKLKDGTDEATAKLSDAKSKLSDPKMQEKLSLIMNENNTSRARRLVEDAFVAQGMDTSAATELLGLMTSGNFDKANALLADVRDLSQYKSTLDSTVTAVNALTGDKKVQKLMGDVTAAKKTYDSIDDSTKQKLQGLSGAVTKENLQKGQQLVKGAMDAETQLNSLMTKGNALKGQVDQLTVQIVKATGSSSVEEAMTKIDTQLAAVNQFYSDEQQAKVKAMLSDVSDYGKGYLVLKAYMAADMKENMAKGADQATAFAGAKTKAKAIVSAVYGNAGGELNTMIDKLQPTQFTEQGMAQDAQKIADYGTQMNTMINTVNGMKPLIEVVAQAKPLLTQAKAVLEGDEVKGLTQFYGAVSNVQNKAFIDSLANAYLSLNENDINSIVTLKNSVATLSADVEANKQNIASIEKMAAGLKGKDKEITAKVNKLEKDMAQAKPLLNSVEALANKADKNSIDQATGMVKTLLSMQNDLKNSDDILRITQDALSKGNVAQARSLVSSLPQLEDGIKQLSDGITQLNDGMKQFSEEGINKINDKGTTAVTDVKDLLKVKDEMVEMSKKFDNFAGKDDSMTSSVKFVMKTEEIKAPEVKKTSTKTTTEKKTGLIEWIKNLFN